MKIKLTLQEKLRDLRDEKKMTLSDLSEETNIPLSTLQRIEGQDDVRVGYQDVAALAKFYGVSTDYLFGLTDNEQHRHIEVDALKLSDPAIETLTGEKFNNRLVSELIAHPDFPKLLNAIEIYIDRKIFPQMNAMNVMYKLAENSIKDNFTVKGNDEIIALLQEAIVDEDEYLRYRISERFNELMKSLFDAHKKDSLPDEQASILQELKDDLQSYPLKEKQEEKERWRVAHWAKKLDLDTTKLTDEELRVLIKALEKSGKYKQGRRR